MKSILIALILAAVMLIPQFEAGFLDGPETVNNPTEWTGSGLYCMEVYYHVPSHSWVRWIVSGPFQEQIDCNAG